MNNHTGPADILDRLALAPPRPEDEVWMRMALEHARLAYGRTAPNPMVGCVLVRDGQLIGQGHHARAGLDHAEIAALKDAQARGHDPAGATLYVNLEPCFSYGRTPPCTLAIIKARIARVVTAMVDPDPRTCGKGLEALIDAGIEVTCGVLEDEAQRLNAPFCTRILHGRPHITAKVAMSLDGKIATRRGDSFPMTGEVARQAVHRLRDRVDAILVGRRTVAKDNPRLTCRLGEDMAGPGGARDPVRIIIDPFLKSPLDAQIFHLQKRGLSKAPTLLVVSGSVTLGRRRQALDGLGVEIIACPERRGGGLDLKILLEVLVERGISSVLVEGGGETLARFMDAGVIDAWIAHVAPVFIGGATAPTPLGGNGVGKLDEATRTQGAQVRRLGQDIEIAVPVAGHIYGLD